MFRFTIRDVLWLTVVLAMGTLLLVQRQQFLAEIENVNDLHKPGVNVWPPPGMRRAIVEFPPHGKGTIRIRYEPIAPNRP
jgi:hypothetical protein